MQLMLFMQTLKFSIIILLVIKFISNFIGFNSYIGYKVVLTY